MKIKYEGKWYEVTTIQEFNGVKWYKIINYEVWVQEKYIEGIEENRDRCAEFKSKIYDLIREFDNLTGEEIHQIFKELSDGTLTQVYQIRKQ